MENSKTIKIYYENKNVTLDEVTNPSDAEILVDKEGRVYLNNETSLINNENYLVDMIPEIIECINKHKEKII